MTLWGVVSAVCPINGSQHQVSLERQVEVEHLGGGEGVGLGVRPRARAWMRARARARVRVRVVAVMVTSAISSAIEEMLPSTLIVSCSSSPAASEGDLPG